MPQYETRQFFREQEHDDVNGFTVIDTGDEKYRIAEKWLASNSDSDVSKDDDVWMDYWITERDLLARIDADKCEPAGTLTDDQFEAVCKKVGFEPEGLVEGTPTGE